MLAARTRRCPASIAVAVTALAMLAGPQAVGATGAPEHGAKTGAVVQTSDGPVRGVARTRYDAWLGIPYASPPVGALRWKAPQRAPRWSGVRDATRFGARCVQGTGWDPGYEEPTLTEDCLYLNIYVPHGDWTGGRNGGRPVLVWIHGGGFTGGAGQDTDPRKYIGSTGAVYVTINYRLGALGFLNLPQLRQEGGGGSFGLLDQQAALRWVQKNIARFGGDPDNVTIAGQSAGGSSVCDQLASTTARGLFQKAVIHSGGCSMASQADADKAGQAYLQTVGCTDPANVLACLRGKSTAELLAAQAKAPIRPSVGDRAFPFDPAVAVQTGRFTRVPVMSGQVENERSLFVFQNNEFLGKPVTAESYEATIRDTYGANADKVLAAYPLSAFASPAAALARVQSDAATYGRLQVQRQLAQWTPTYVYELDEKTTPQFYSIFRLQWLGEPARSFPFGATHVDDLPYLWEYLGHTLPFSDDQLELSDQMIGFWSAFQHRASPNEPHLPEWPRFNGSQEWMSLAACDTPESSEEPPAACSEARDISSLVAYHKLDFWASIVG